MKCDIIIPVWNQPEHTRTCIEHIVRNTKFPYRLILVDNGSSAETKEYLEKLAVESAGKLLIRNENNMGFVKAVNQGLKASDAPYVCVMNNDTIPARGWLENMIEFAEEHPDVGLLNPQCDGHGSAAIDTHAERLARNKGAYMEMNQCFGYCMLIKREVIDKIGYLDEAFGVGNYDDTDYSMRAGKAGYRCVNVHSSYVYHKKHVSFRAMGDRDSLVSKGALEYFRKWPRHLRMGISFHMREGIADGEIENMLKAVLFLAREWCWVNLWIFGDKSASKNRIEEASRRIGMPLHQNIKFNYFPGRFTAAQAAVRVIERSFGTKKRKKYDAVLVDDDRMFMILRAMVPLHRTRICHVRFDRDAAKGLMPMIEELREPKA
ncbi:MAG: glycosyltransferase family 2 protein [Candidatus Omnitrophica bacterium]|nr:glycosyltransferase family 2 protein [Candidatus Omnitrophota bacterium]